MPRWPFRPTPSPGALHGDADQDIRDELELYLELRTEELVAEGMDPVEARAEAEARFGDPKEVAHRVRRETVTAGGGHKGRMMMGDLRQDLAFAFRTFRRSPGFTLMATLTLAVALAGNTAIFSVLDAAVLRALPFESPDGLVFVNGYHLQDGQHAIRMASVPEFRDWQERSRAISPMVGVDGNSVTLSGAGQAERVVAEVVSEGYFDLLGGQPLLGRTFTEEEYATPDGYPVVVLSSGLWQRSFGGAADIIGRTVEVNEQTVSVVGVMREDFVGVGLDVDMWIPMGMMSLVGPGLLDARGTRFLPVIGRLTPGTSLEEAQQEMDVIAVDLQEQFPRINEDRFAEVQAFRDQYLGTTGRLLWVLFAAGAFLLLIASANVANLLLVRANARLREMTVRRAVGAGGRRIARQLLTESVALFAMGGLGGLILAAWGLRVLTPMIPEGVLPGYAHPALSGRAFLFTLAVLAVAGVAAGLAPAMASARRDLAGSLRAGVRSLGRGGARVQQIFVVTQVGLALLLMVGAGLLTRSFREQLLVDPGMDVEGIYAFRVELPRERYPDAASLRQFTDGVVRAVGDVPGVTSVAASSDFPFRGGSSGSYVARPDDPQTRIRYHVHSVSPGYFENLGAELLAGRFIEDQDQADARGVAVVTEAFVRRVFPEVGNGVGQTFWIGNPSDPDNLAEIVGVVEDVRFRNLTQDMMEESNSPDVFFSLAQVPRRTLEISYRASGDGAATGAAIRTAVASLDPAIPVYALASLEDLYRAQTATPRFAAFLMGLFSALALTLACVGIYGVLSFTVGQRGPEIALRRALGAQAGDVARSVVWSGTRLAAGGLLVGGVCALLGGRVLQALLFNVRPTDPSTFGTVGVSMMVVAILAAVVPAWRASRKAPADVLRAD